MLVIPSIDLLGGKVVRLMRGSYDAVTVYSDDPAALAAAWSGIVPLLHVVDLDGARDGRASQGELVGAIRRAFAGELQVGGGVRTLDAVEAHFQAGAARVVLGTAAIEAPELVTRAAARWPNRIVVAVDARDGRVATRGWVETSTRTAVDVARELSGTAIAALLYTDVDRDGTGTGPNLEATARLAEQGGLPVIASGGVGSLADLEALARLTPALAGAIIGRALHERRFTLREATDATEAARA